MVTRPPPKIMVVMILNILFLFIRSLLTMLGKKFRELRKSQHKSINEVAKGITSFSSLRRWESGEGEMSLNKVIALVKRINVSPKEYMDIIGESDEDLFEAEISNYYENNNIDSLKEIANFFLQKHINFPTDQLYYFRSAMACNFYMDLTGENIFPKEEVSKLGSYFLPIENWTQKDILLFGNTVLLISQQDIYWITRSIYYYASKQKSTRTFCIITVNTLLNVVFVMLKKGEESKAKQILNWVETIKKPTNFTNEKIRIHFMNALFKYIDWHDSSDIKTLVNNLYALDLENKAEDYIFAFKQIKEIYC